MREPNDLLRHARERTESPGASGEFLTRQELADLVNSWLFDHHGLVSELDANYVGKLEQGVIRWPQDARRREAFRTALGAPTDVALGFRRPRRTSSSAKRVDCQPFIGSALGLAATVAIPMELVSTSLADLQRAPVPHVVGASDVADVRAAATAFGELDSTYGGAFVREAVTAQLKRCVEMLNSRCTPEVRSSLFSSVGYLSHVTAFMAFDAYQHDDARQMFRLALSCAEEVNDWNLRAKVLSSMSRQAIWCNDPDAGLTYIELALVRADRLTQTERAMLHTARARALAKLGDIPGTARAIDTADHHFGDTRPAEDPPWMAYYDTAQHSGDTGHALWDTAILGFFGTEAYCRLAAAVSGHGTRHVRARTISQVKLASLVMKTGDPHEAAQLGIEALESSYTIRSHRLADDLRTLHQFSVPHNSLPDVAELGERIRTVASR